MPRIRTTTQGSAVDRAIGSRIAQARQSARVTQAQLGAAVGITAAAVGFYESGRNQVAVSRLLAIATALRVDPVTLFPAERDFPLVLAA